LAATLADISSSFGEGRELGVEAKLRELVDEAFGPDFLRAAIVSAARCQARKTNG
jgi:hypothetical protein